MYNKAIIEFGFVISGIIKVSAIVISLSLRPRLITLASTLIILDITKTSSNYCLFLLLLLLNPDDGKKLKPFGLNILIFIYF